MSFLDDFADAITQSKRHEATNLTAIVLHMEQARECLQEIQKLAKKIEGYFVYSDYSRCRECCKNGLEGTSEEVLEAAINECKNNCYDISTNVIMKRVAVLTEFLDRFEREDAALANYIRNA